MLRNWSDVVIDIKDLLSEGFLTILEKYDLFISCSGTICIIEMHELWKFKLNVEKEAEKLASKTMYLK